MIVNWTDLAIYSYEEEVLFVLRKWNLEEAEKFSILVFDFIDILETGTIQGRATYDSKINSYVISKQTTIYYQLRNEKTVELLLFWNNQKDPQKLKAILLNL